MKEILIVDDSYFARRIITEIIDEISCAEVAGTASNGVKAMEFLMENSVDLVTLDIEMPEMDGYRLLRRLRAREVEVPVLVVSSVTEENSDKAAKALEMGAADVLPKPAGEEAGGGLESVKEEFGKKIRALVEQCEHSTGGTLSRSQDAGKETRLRSKLESVKPELVVIGGSTGAPPIIHDITARFPEEFPLPVVIIQHMKKSFLKGLAKNISHNSRLDVQAVEGGRQIKGGTIYLPGEEKHLVFRRGGEKIYIRLKGGEPVNGSLPSVDVTFKSAAELSANRL